MSETNAKPAQRPKLKLDVGKQQGYGKEKYIVRAANRALRWLQNPKNASQKPPRHIREKLLLIGV